MDKPVPRWVTYFIVCVPIAIITLGVTIVCVVADTKTDKPIQSAKAELNFLK